MGARPWASQVTMPALDIAAGLDCCARRWQRGLFCGVLVGSGAEFEPLEAVAISLQRASPGAAWRSQSTVAERLCSRAITGYCGAQAGSDMGHAVTPSQSCQ